MAAVAAVGEALAAGAVAAGRAVVAAAVVVVAAAAAIRRSQMAFILAAAAAMVDLVAWVVLGAKVARGMMAAEAAMVEERLKSLPMDALLSPVNCLLKAPMANWGLNLKVIWAKEAAMGRGERTAVGERTVIPSVARAATAAKGPKGVMAVKAAMAVREAWEEGVLAVPSN